MTFTPQTSVTATPAVALAGMIADSGHKDIISRLLTVTCLAGLFVCGDHETAEPPDSAGDVTGNGLGGVAYEPMSEPSSTGFAVGHSVSIVRWGRLWMTTLAGAAPTAGSAVYVYRGATEANRGKVTQNSGAADTSRADGCHFTGRVASGLAEVQFEGIGVGDATAAVASELASDANGQGASLIGIEDADDFTTAGDVEAALAELYQNALTTQGMIHFPLNAFVEKATGAPLVAFSDGVADGFDYIEGVGYRFNVGSTDAIACTVPVPQDLDDAADIVLHVLGARVGAADATAVLTVECFFQTVGAAYDADANAGGSTTAFDGATTVVTEETLAIAAANVPPAPCAMSITLVPSAALDADDLRVIAVWAEYTKKLLTA
jgi:hypothetical protein